jgi:hypothetical protein
MLLVESVRDGVVRGTTEDYLHVSGLLPDARAGDVVPVVLRASVDGQLRGYYVDEEDAPGPGRAT